MEQIHNQQNTLNKELFYIGDQIYHLNERLSYLKQKIFILKDEYNKNKSEKIRNEISNHSNEFNKLLEKKREYILQRDQNYKKSAKLQRVFHNIIKKQVRDILFQSR